MPLVYTDHHGGFFVKVGCYYSSSAHSGAEGFFYQMDPVRSLINGLSVDFGWFHLEDTIGVFRDKGASEVLTFAATKPQMIEYSDSGDFSRYGSMLSHLAATGKLLRGEDLLSFNPRSEHQTWHPSYQGYVGPRLEDDLYTYSPTVGSSVIYGSNPAFFSGVVRGNYVPNNLNGLYCTRVTGTPSISGVQFAVEVVRPVAWAPRADLLTTLLWLRDEVIAGGELVVSKAKIPGTGGPWYGRVSDFTVDYSLYEITCRYRYVWSDTYPGNTYHMGHSVMIRAKLVPNISTPTSHVTTGIWYNIVPVGAFSLTCETTLTDVSPSVLPWWPIQAIGGKATFTNTTPGWVYLSRAVQGDGSGAAPDLTRFVQRRRLSTFEDKVWKEMGSIRLSSMQSASDALDDITGNLNTNLIETLSEMRQLSDLMPDMRRILSSYLKLRRGDPVGSFRDLMDFLTALRLQSAFGWDPNLDLLLNVLPKMQSLVTSILDQPEKRLVIGRGSYNFDFPEGEFGRVDATLRTRSRVVANPGASSVVAKMLDVRSLGLLPSPSSLWDLVPFSFVVDWFSGIGARLSDLEAISFLLLTNIEVYTHSYTISSLLTEEELAMDRLAIASTNQSDNPMLKVYARDVSKHPPRFAQGKYDFRLPTRLPNWMTAGSLSWQLLVAR